MPWEEYDEAAGDQGPPGNPPPSPGDSGGGAGSRPAAPPPAAGLDTTGKPGALTWAGQARTMAAAASQRFADAQAALARLDQSIQADPQNGRLQFARGEAVKELNTAYTEWSAAVGKLGTLETAEQRVARTAAGGGSASSLAQYRNATLLQRQQEHQDRLAREQADAEFRAKQEQARLEQQLAALQAEGVRNQIENARFAVPPGMEYVPGFEPGGAMQYVGSQLGFAAPPQRATGVAPDFDAFNDALAAFQQRVNPRGVNPSGV